MLARSPLGGRALAACVLGLLGFLLDSSGCSVVGVGLHTVDVLLLSCEIVEHSHSLSSFFFFLLLRTAPCWN